MVDAQLAQVVAAMEQMNKRLEAAEAKATAAEEALRVEKEERARSPGTGRTTGSTNSQEDMMRLMVERVKETMKEVKPARTLVDNKAIGKPPIFKGEEAKFQAWSMKFKAFLSGIWQNARNVLEWAAESETPLTDDDITEHWIEGC